MMPHQQVFHTEKVERSQDQDDSMKSASLEGNSDDDLFPDFPAKRASNEILYEKRPSDHSSQQEVIQQITPRNPNLNKSQDEILDLEFDGTRRSKTYMPDFDVGTSGGNGLLRSNEDIREQSDGFQPPIKRQSTLEENKDQDGESSDRNGFDERFGHLMKMSDGSSQGIRFTPRVIISRATDERKFSKHSTSNKSYSEFLQQQRRQSDTSMASSDSYGHMQ